MHSYIRWALIDSIAPQFDAFARGFNKVAGRAGGEHVSDAPDSSFAGGPALELFRAEELQLLVNGSKVSVVVACGFRGLRRPLAGA